MSNDVIGAHFVLGHSNNMALKPNHLIETIHVQKNHHIFQKFQIQMSCDFSYLGVPNVKCSKLAYLSKHHKT